MSFSPNHRSAPRVTLGPVSPGWGSWEWIGADLRPDLERHFSTSLFDFGEIPETEVILLVKHLPPREWWEEVSASACVIYCPVDHYGAAAEIDADGDILRRCARIMIHCERLRKYVAPYAPVDYIDHHVKFVCPEFAPCPTDGPILWVGVRTNLPPLVEWINVHSLPRELLVLTNPEDPNSPVRAEEFGFRDVDRVRIERWTPDRHREALTEAVAALDVKGDDFRSRHKPPAKALDFLAAGLPLAMNADCSSAEHLARLGFDVATPEDPEWWLSREYVGETQRFGAAIREILSRERIARRWRRIIEDVWEERSTYRVQGRVPLAIG